jgi:hypothetical protein
LAQWFAVKGHCPSHLRNFENRKVLREKSFRKKYWVSQIDINDRNGLYLEHIVQFLGLWEMIHNSHLVNDDPDEIS